MNSEPASETDTLPAGIRSRTLADINGLEMHILEANYDNQDCPLILLLHGFPELAFSWRKLMLPLCELGYHVVAPDQRGYGSTTGWSDQYDDPLQPFSLLNLAEDAAQLVSKLGHQHVHCVIGHDFGSPVAAVCALSRPDLFRSVVMMSAPFGGAPKSAGSALEKKTAMDMALANLLPPHQHYQSYYSSREANADMRYAQQGITDFLRAYYHYKSADWAGNQPYRLKGWDADELVKMPTYYIMAGDNGMANTVAPYLPSQEECEACIWLTVAELQYYARSFERTGFQGGLQWYRCSFDLDSLEALSRFHGKQITVPSGFIAGAQDWGTFQVPGALEAMQNNVCSDMKLSELIEGAGHWVQQEKPIETFNAIRNFLNQIGPR